MKFTLAVLVSSLVSSAPVAYSGGSYYDRQFDHNSVYNSQHNHGRSFGGRSGYDGYPYYGSGYPSYGGDFPYYGSGYPSYGGDFPYYGGGYPSYGGDLSYGGGFPYNNGYQNGYPIYADFQGSVSAGGPQGGFPSRFSGGNTLLGSGNGVGAKGGLGLGINLGLGAGDIKL